MIYTFSRDAHRQQSIAQVVFITDQLYWYQIKGCTLALDKLLLYENYLIWIFMNIQ